MHDCLVTMKDGRKFCGLIWKYCPKEGYVTIVDSTAPEIIYFCDVESMTGVVRTHPYVVESVDILASAREDGWDGT